MIQHILKTFIAILLILGIVVSQAYVVGFEYHRFFTPSWFFMGAAILIMFTPPVITSRWSVWVHLSLCVLTIYIGGRGTLAELSFLGGKDFPVLFYGLVVFMGVSVITKTRRAFGAVLATGLGLFVYQVAITLAPGAITENLPRAWGELVHEREGVVGLFRHHNPFASYCGLGIAVVMATCFVKTRHNKAVYALPFGAIILALLTIFAAYQSGSRLGMAVVVLTALIVVVLGLLLRFIFSYGRIRSNNRVSSAILLLIIGLFASIGLFTKSFNVVSAARNASGEIGADSMEGLRISAMSMGVSLWQENPLIGNGPRSYWVNAPRLREDGKIQVVRFTDPEMVHNDYIQTLAEYGIIGLLLILLAVFAILRAIWKLAYLQRFVNENWIIPPVIAISATAGIMVHSLADFTMHNTPVFGQLALILGACYGYLGTRYVSSAPSGKACLWISTFRGVSLLGGGVFLFVFGKDQIINNMALVKYDYVKWHGSEVEVLEETRKVVSLAPEPILYEDLGVRLSASASAQTQNRLQLMKEAENAFEQAYVLHPYRLPVLVNLAVMKSNLKKWDEANQYLGEAFEVSNNRWPAYELDRVAISYLIKKGELLWLQERNATLAMAHFLEAQKYIYEGRMKHSRQWNKTWKRYANKVEEYLTVMEAGKIEPATDITFFEGKGL